MRRRDLLACCLPPSTDRLSLRHRLAKVNEKPQRLTELYFYPAPYRLPEGAIIYSPFAVDTGCCTTLFPKIKEMQGLVVLPYWSQICRRRGAYDFSLVDEILRYWEVRGKRLVIGVVTVGFPLRIGQNEVIDATPAWLLDDVLGYDHESVVVGSAKPAEPGVVRRRFACYWDTKFQAAVRHLVRELARYDGHPAVSAIRISTGISGEDNPTFDGLRAGMPGFSNRAWIDYCWQTVALYRRTFHRTLLEFDVDRMGWIKAEGTEADRAYADAFMRDLSRQGVYLAMDGLDTVNSLDWMRGRNTGPAKSIDYLVRRREQGHQVGLEGAGISGLTENDLEIQAAVFRDVNASRLVLFSDSAGAINYVRNGANAANAATVDLFGDQKLREIALNSQKFFSAVGIPH